ncbi:GNAT family N-acetyltransferase [Bacillus velezensis]|nr:GNAT family N-acetyltransferase [Bacillus velezensis]
MKDFNKPNEPFVVSGESSLHLRAMFGHIQRRNLLSLMSKNMTMKTLMSVILKKRIKLSFYYAENDCVGRSKLRSNWNGYALIEDIAVAEDYRKNGVGTALLHKAIEWAKENHLCGLMLETQDINVSACHFYAKNNFVIGAVDTMLYSNFSTANEIAVFGNVNFRCFVI